MARRKSKQTIQSEVIMVVYALIAIMLVVIAYFKLGILGVFLHRLSLVLFGMYPIFVYMIVVVVALYLIYKRKWPSLHGKVRVGMLLAVIVIYLYIALASTTTELGFQYLRDYLGQFIDVFNESSGAQAGIFGAILYGIISALVAREGTWVVLFTLTVVAMYLMLGPIIFPTFKWKMPNFKPKKKISKASATMETPVAKTMDEAIAKSEARKSVFIESDSITKDRPIVQPSTTSTDQKTSSAATIDSIKPYQIPSIALLDAFRPKRGSSVNNTVAQQKGKKLIELLEQFQIHAELITYHIGPSVTKFEVRPDSNVKISKIASLSDNIKMQLQAKDIRIEAPIPGRNAVGVEIPNVEMTPVRLHEIMQQVPQDKKDKKLLFALGKDLMGRSIFGELDKMPHLLIAGATGSGKSVCVNSIITTLLLRTTPSEVKLLLIDPKKVEFTTFHDLPHLIGPVISDAAMAAKSLKIIVNMMENRYDVFAKVGVRNISAYNEKVLAYPDEHLAIMPWIVVIIDELADLMIVAGKEVESSIQRITQLARAAGIHLIVATQRPSTDVITGIIKANIPSRIAFAVTSNVDSRTILDYGGAEKLLGYGDMLYVPIGEPNPIRIQGVFVSDDEVRKVAQAAIGQGKPMYDDAFIQLEGVENNEGFVQASEDPLYQEVKSFVIHAQKASTSMIQRRFSLGYNRAARMMDSMEAEGVIGPASGSKPREVYQQSDD
jgi:DNA segregation ATPase FtsK/SpoIIIE, S-DNA-T family